MLYEPHPNVLDFSPELDDLWIYLPQDHPMWAFPAWRDRVAWAQQCPERSVIIKGRAYWLYQPGESGSFLPNDGRPSWIVWGGICGPVLLWDNGHIPDWARPYLPDNAQFYMPTREELYAYNRPAGAALPR